jgi:hypothetical protein
MRILRQFVIALTAATTLLMAADLAGLALRAATKGSGFAARSGIFAPLRKAPHSLTVKMIREM